MESDTESAGYPERDELRMRPVCADPSSSPRPSEVSLRFRLPASAEPGGPRPLSPGRAEVPERGEGLNSELTVHPRDAPLPLFKKRILRQIRADSSVPESSWRPRQRDAMRTLRAELCHILSYLEVWKGSLHRIEGHFGTGIRSYFGFLRYLVILNLCTSVLTTGFIVLPAICFERLRAQGQLQSIDLPPSTGNCTAYDPKRLGLVNFYEYALDVLTGTGLLELSYLFYGFYPAQNVRVQGFTYHSGLAYLLTNITYFLLTFGWITHRAVMGFKRSQVQGDSDLDNCSRKVFSGWDFCITERGAVSLKHSILRSELQMDLQEQFRRQRIASRTGQQTALLYLTRLGLNLLVLAVLGAAFFSIYKATAYSQLNSTTGGITGLLIQYLPSIVVTAANLITPVLFNQLVTWEQYSPAMEVQLTLLRSVFLKFASLGVLLYTLWTQITCNGDSDRAGDCGVCGYNYKMYQCWETKIGQEMYKLMIFDFLIVIAVMILVDFPRKMLVLHARWKVVALWGQQEFTVPQHVLEMVYGQTVCWTGSFYCPLLPLLNTLKYILVFYLKQLTLFTNCRPSNKTFRASSSTFFFLLILLFGLALASVPLIYTITAIPPSRACGPFRDLETIWETVGILVDTLPATAKQFLTFVGSLAFLVPLLALASVILLFLVIQAMGYTHTIYHLKRQLQQEGRDKQFLLKQIAAFEYNPHPSL